MKKKQPKFASLLVKYLKLRDEGYFTRDVLDAISDCYEEWALIENENGEITLTVWVPEGDSAFMNWVMEEYKKAICAEFSDYGSLLTGLRSIKSEAELSAMREGALDAYDKVLFRMNWNNGIRRDSQIVCDGKTYQILSLDGDHMENKIEALAQEIVE